MLSKYWIVKIYKEQDRGPDRYEVGRKEYNGEPTLYDIEREITELKYLENSEYHPGRLSAEVDIAYRIED